MPMTLSGDGTITGLAAGGLPDSSIATADIANAAITAAKLDGAQSGSAPIYAARAWVNFNGTGTVAIRASGNVSSITDNGTGDYTVNFTTAMADANYAWFGMAKNVDGAANYNYPSVGSRSTTVPATSSIRIGTAFQQAASASDFDYVYVSVFR